MTAFISILKHTLPLSIILWLGAILLHSCEPDLKEVDRIANMKKGEAVDISYGVAITYSDSALVKAVLTSPEMRVHHDTTSNYEFPKGVKIVFYDALGKESQQIVSDYAIQREKEKTTTFKKNVVITRIDGSIIKTEELIYDENSDSFYNHVMITGFFKDGRGNLQGSSFTSDADFKDVRIQNATGLYYIQDNSAFPSFGN